MKRYLAATTLCFYPFLASADGSDAANKLLSTFVQSANSVNPTQVAQQAIENYALSAANRELTAYTAEMQSERWKHLSLSLGQDRGELQLEGMSVYGIHEDKNLFLFNQTSLVNYDGRTTLNFGLGARNINDDETVIFGVNAFYDYEFESLHRRAGLGAEVLTSVAQLRANYYKALTGERLHDGIFEEALDGYDVKLTYELPYFYSSNTYFEVSRWYDDGAYKVSSREFGVSAEVRPNLLVSLGVNQDDDESAQGAASLSYNYVFGSRPDRRVQRDGVFRFALEPVRHMLYQPVERENRIIKKSVTLGVTASGF